MLVERRTLVQPEKEPVKQEEISQLCWRTSQVNEHILLSGSQLVFCVKLSLL